MNEWINEWVTESLLHVLNWNYLSLELPLRSYVMEWKGILQLLRIYKEQHEDFFDTTQSPE